MVPGNFTWDQFNKFMTNVGDEEFNYDSFKAAYDSNPAIQTMVQRFSQDGIELKTKAKTADQQTGQQDNNAVSQMAKRATKAAQNA